MLLLILFFIMCWETSELLITLITWDPMTNKSRAFISLLFFTRRIASSTCSTLRTSSHCPTIYISFITFRWLWTSLSSTTSRCSNSRISTSPWICASGLVHTLSNLILGIRLSLSFKLRKSKFQLSFFNFLLFILIFIKRLKHFLIFLFCSLKAHRKNFFHIP